MVQTPTSPEYTDSDNLFIYKRDGVNHPTLLESADPTLDNDGNLNMPDGVLRFRSFGMGHIQWGLSAVETETFAAFLSMNVSSSTSAEHSLEIVKSIKRLHNYQQQSGLSHSTLFHPGADYGVTLVLEMFEDEVSAVASWEETTKQMARGNLAVRPLDWDMDALEPLGEERQLLTIHQQGHTWYQGSPSPN